MELEGNLDHDYEDIFSKTKISEALGTFGDKKAPGLDGFPPKVLKEVCKGPNLARLQAIYKASYGLGYVPRCWRSAKAKTIVK